MPPSNNQPNSTFQNTVNKVKPSIPFVVIIMGALIAFEIFNYSTTDHALADLLGGLTFAGIQWSTILALAFCGIDFAGIARLFTPEQGADEPKEVWYLFGAWLLAATMNAILTWWGVSMAVMNHTVQSSAVIDPQTIANVVPVFVAVMVWVIRILIIGTLSLAMDRLMHPGAEQHIPIQTAISATAHRVQTQHQQLPVHPTQPMSTIPASLGSASIPQRPSMSRAAASQRINRNSISSEYEERDPQQSTLRAHPEPTYHTLSMSARPSINKNGANANENNGANRFRRS